MNIAEALALRGKPNSYARQENVWLLEHFLGLSRLELIYRGTQLLSAEQEKNFLDALSRIAQGEPLAYITGSQPFWSLNLKVTPDTLVPRPDTEVLIEVCLQLNLPEQARIVDLGTGTGAIALSLASEKPAWVICATDIYEPTLKVAQYNAEKHDLKHVKFYLGEWYQAFAADQDKRFDLIVSNPPYIDADDEHMKNLQKEPKRALVAANHGLSDIEMIIYQGRNWLNHAGWIMVEHGYKQGCAVRDIFLKAGFDEIQTIQDYGGNDRVTMACFYQVEK